MNESVMLLAMRAASCGLAFSTSMRNMRELRTCSTFTVCWNACTTCSRFRRSVLLDDGARSLP